MKPPSDSASATSWARAGTEATKLSVPVVWAVPLVPPAICWSIVVMETGSELAPTLSMAVTPVGAFPVPASAVAWVTERVKATKRRPVPAT